MDISFIFLFPFKNLWYSFGNNTGLYPFEITTNP